MAATPSRHEPQLDLDDADSIMTENTPIPENNNTRPPQQYAPNGPLCAYGKRLGYTYFASPAPDASVLNHASTHTTIGKDIHWITVDHELIYLSFFQEKGPLNVGCVYRFCIMLHQLLESAEHKGKRIVLYSSDEADKKANAALLLALYVMIVMRWSPADALHPIACLELQPFRDAGYARADYHLSVQDVLFGVKRAIDLRLLRLDEFNINDYEHYEKVENGDWNFITPYFLAFASPTQPNYPHASAVQRLPKAFRNVLEFFPQYNVKTVVRLNKKLYDENLFIEKGMEHKEMYFDDGTNPTLEMCRQFIDLSENIVKQNGVIAVHCKAGLGRTGTLIGAYMIYKWGFTASEAIGFMRIMRPGSCVGPQQHYLYQNQMTYNQWGAIDRFKLENPLAALPMNARPITPPHDGDPPITSLVVPSTPQRSSSPVQNADYTVVPGQPRKTPGAKTRHTVAAPEAADQSIIDANQLMPDDEDDENEDSAELEGTPSPEGPPRQVDAVVEEDKMDIVDLEPQASRPAATRVRSRQQQAPATARQPSRIAKPRQRPLSAITDNRVVDRIGLGKDGIARSKAVPDLGTLFEADSSKLNGLGLPSTSNERYNLRGTRAISSPSAPRPQPQHTNTSPSRLPTRVAKRKSQKNLAAQVEAAAATTPPIPTRTSERLLAAAGVPPPNPAEVRIGGRSVRRRRSSMGAAD